MEGPSYRESLSQEWSDRHVPPACVTTEPGECSRVWPRVLFVSMPFAGLERPSIGVSLLKSILAIRGVLADIRYLNWDFAKAVGLDTYSFITDWKAIPHDALVGEWLFTEALYGVRADVDVAFLASLRAKWLLGEETIGSIVAVRDACTRFIDECARATDWAAYDIVGFTSMFEQNLASLALARRVKELYPRVLIAFGGANFEGEMGQELHRQFEFIDLICSGEADESFPAAVEAVAAGRPLDGIPGIVFRREGESVSTQPGPVFRDLDGLPYPDYDEYFATRDAYPRLAEKVSPLVLLQTARGCWWGERSHCTFCGLNGGTMLFRSKSAERVLDELKWLRERYGVRVIDTVDEILDMRYFRTMLPAVEQASLDVELFYEVKANLTHKQVGQMARGRITSVQPGIESLSDHVLDLMGKGTTALKNIQLLKWCREYGITVYWNLLYGIPGEYPEDYAEIERIIRSIWFLDPPTGGAVRLRVDRFSPYHADPHRFGLSEVRASDAYRFLYDVDDEARDRIAYYFDFEYGDGRTDPGERAASVLPVVAEWLADTDRGALLQRRSSDTAITLVDTRPGGHSREHALDGWQAALFLFLDIARGEQDLAAAPFLANVAADEVAGSLDQWERDGLVIRYRGHVLNLAVHDPPCHPASKSAPSPIGVRAAPVALTSKGES